MASLRESCLELESSALELVVKASLLPHRDYSSKTQKRKDRQKPVRGFLCRERRPVQRFFALAMELVQDNLRTLPSP